VTIKTSDEAKPVISIYGAREHNLKDLTFSIPRNQFVVITGVSGSGKSTLAFDLLFAEGQRRFLDSMSAYARQFVEQLARPEVDLISGLPPTVSIEQRVSHGGGKSTVATVTEIYHFFRLLFARLGAQFCPDCQVPVAAQTSDQLGDCLKAELKARGDLRLLAPVVKNRKGFHTDIAQWAAKHGYAEIRADGRICSTSEPFRLDRFREHDVEIVVGLLERNARHALAAKKTPPKLIDEALQLGQGTFFALGADGRISVHSTERACPQCGKSYEPLDPKNFSYNSAQGWCRTCRGFGELFYLPDVDRGARADAIEESWFEWQEGKREPCPDCQGSRLNAMARSVRLDLRNEGRASPKPSGKHAIGPTIVALSDASVQQSLAFFRSLKFSGRAAEIARDILPEIRERLRFLCEVGLGYLQLDRSVTTLSGGEAQRIRLAAQLGSNLSGVLYILDEPTIGLHPRDNEQLLAALDMLKRRGNSLVVVEHDPETMRRADYIVDLGPGAGVRGGEVVAVGTLDELMRIENSVTGQCLRAQRKFPSRGQRRPVSLDEKTRRSNRGSGASNAAKTPCLILTQAARNNLKRLTVAFPLNRFVVVTGVSGSGKSTLIHECLLPTVQHCLRRERGQRSESIGCGLKGFESIKAVYEVDQSPIGRTLRSAPATYVGFFDEIRQLFSQTPEARLRGYSPSRFSFNSTQGRCPTCEGAGTIKLEMNFMPPAYVQCQTCNSTRFDPETLDIECRGKNIAQVLDMSVAEAIEFFAAFKKIRRPLEALQDTGLSYLKLGQISPTLSGGEAQRIKLVTHLLTGLKDSPEGLRKATRHNLFILEEPTIGLHMADVQKLVEVLQRLVDAGHSVIVIEHNLELIAEADWIVDLGPEAGAGGGQIIAQGAPETIARTKGSQTGRFLRSLLAN